MGRQQASKIYKTKRYTRDSDRILQEDLKSKAAVHALKNQSFDEYLPGLGQHYCVPCAKYFESDRALTTHTKSKVHKREIKNIKFGPYTPEEAASGAGRDVEKYLAKKQLQEQLISQQDAGQQELNLVKKDSHIKRRKGDEMAVEAESMADSAAEGTEMGENARDAEEISV